MASGCRSGLARGRARRRSGTAAFLAACAFLLLPAAPATRDCTAAERLEFQEVAAHGFARLSGDAGTIEPLYDMVNRYLDTVQPNPFPTDIFQSLLRDQRVEPIKVVKYEAGYIVSLIIGALFFILMPLAGLLFCCCRCCGRCGGRVKERTGETDSQRNTLAALLLLVTLIVLAGVACAFTANQKLTESLETSMVEIKLTIGHVVSYIESFSKAAPAIAAQFSVPQNRVLAELDGLNRSLGFTIQGALVPVVLPALEMLTARVRDFSETESRLMTVNSTQHSLLGAQRQLERELQAVRPDIRVTLSSPKCQGCETSIARLEDLRLDFNYREPSEFQAVLQNVGEISQKDLNGSLDEGNRAFRNIPATVTSQTSRIIADIKATVWDIRGNVTSAAGRLQLTDPFGKVTDILQGPQVSETTAAVRQYDRYRWIVAIVLCCIILLIIACNALGLGFGTAGIATRSDPYSANACSLSGANFLMAGVGISFIFSWLLILLVFVTFFVGGNVRTLVCKPWETGEIYQALSILATSNNFFNLSNLIDPQLDISGIHSHCREGASIFDLLPQSQRMELNNSLNISTYTDVFKQSAERLNVDVGGTVLLNEAGRLNLLTFAKSGINDLNYTELIRQISQPIVKGSLLDLARALETLESAQSDAKIKSNLLQQAMRLREIQNTTVRTMQGHLAQLNASFQYLSSSAPTVQGRVEQTINNVKEAEAGIQNTTQAVIRNVTQCLINKQIDYFHQYLNWVQATIINDLLSCQPAIILLDNARILACDYVTDPWNAFWFCLGWCTLFLIPSIIFAVKTAKHYRPVKNKAASPEFSEMANFKFPRVQNAFAPTGTGLYESPAP